MNGDYSLGWWIVTGVLVAGELATGTFYLLMIAIGCVAGALAGYADASFVAQVIVAAAVGTVAVAAWHRLRQRGPAPVPPEANRDINLDVGERVEVEAWRPDGTARVRYRGAAWNVRYVGEGPPAPGAHVIDEVRHNELALKRAA
jgi:membrane protein implicated in regulation of membrane protease activity